MLHEKILGATTGLKDRYKIDRERGGIERGVPFYEWASGLALLSPLDTQLSIDTARGDVFEALQSINDTFREVTGIATLLVALTVNEDGAPLFILAPRT